MSAADRTEARLRHGRECHEGVTRKGEFQPCDKPAIALRDSREDDAYYPVCAYHARGFCLPLVDPDDAAALVAALRAVLEEIEKRKHTVGDRLALADVLPRRIEEALP